MVRSENNAADGTESDKERARKARKRVTDRKSQRHHRERQRAYMRELEETVESYKNSCARNGGADMEALVAENEKLRRRCLKLESIIAKINTLTSELGIDPVLDHDVEKPLTPPETSADGVEGEATPTLPTSEGESSLSSMDMGIDAPAEPGKLSDHSPEFSSLLMDSMLSDAFSDDLNELIGVTSCPDPSGSTDAVDFFETETAPQDSMEDATDLANDLATNHCESDLDRCISGFLDGTAISLDLIPTSLTMRDPLLSRLSREAMHPGASREAESTMQMLFPAIAGPSNRWDKYLHRMVEETRVQLSIGQYATDQPSLRSVLSSKSTDVLASRLYHLVSGYGPMPLHCFLSIFWVQYLFLRWYVLGTRTAYLQMPEFMRPTDLERRIPHSLSIGMIVWPDIRRAMIRDSLTSDPESIGVELLQHLGKAWSPTGCVTGDLIGSTDVLAVIERQARQMDTWKLDPKFYERNGAFSHCTVPLAVF